MMRPCLVCGKEFYGKPNQFHSGKKKYCSRDCMALAYQERLKGTGNPNYHEAVHKRCKWCGQEFTAYRKMQIYCSSDCAKISPVTRKKLSIATSERWLKSPWPMPRPVQVKKQKSPKVKKPSRQVEQCCVVCGNLFVRCWSQNKVTCSWECRSVNIATRQKGELSHRWEGGKTGEARLVRASAEYAKWRNMVYLRDDYTCCICNERGDRLAAHHIKPFAQYPDLRLVVSNGISLCWFCHLAIKSKEALWEALFQDVVECRMNEIVECLRRVE